MKAFKEEISSSDIERITPLEDGKYEVYFTFSDVPVIMNRGYLETVLPKRQAYEWL